MFPDAKFVVARMGDDQAPWIRGILPKSSSKKCVNVSSPNSQWSPGFQRPKNDETFIIARKELQTTLRYVKCSYWGPVSPQRSPFSCEHHFDGRKPDL